MTTIKLKNGSGAPAASDLVQGEPALDLTNKRLYSEDASGNVIEVGTNPTTLTVDTDTLVVDASNNRVGIGTTTVNRKLELSGNNNAGAKANYLRITDTDTTATAANQQGGIEFFASDSSAGAGVTASMEVVYAGSGGGGEITFNTAANSGAGVAEAMRIDESGNVGIGDSTPASRLQVSASGTDNAPSLGSIDSNAQLYLTNNDPAYGLVFGNNASTGHSWIQAQRVDGTATAYNITLNEAGGNVGIGTTNPGRLLDVQNSGGAAFVSVVSSTSDTAGLLLGDTDTDHRGRVEYDNSSDALKLYTASSTRVTVNSSGDFLVGTTSAAVANEFSMSFDEGLGCLTVNCPTTTGPLRLNQTVGDTASRNQIRFFRSEAQVGSITSDTSATAYNTSSDVRLKENIVDAPAGNIDGIRVRSFDWKSDGTHQPYGMIAQELVSVAPEVVHQGETDDDMWEVDYSKLVPMMIKEIQDLKAEVAALKGA